MYTLIDRNTGLGYGPFEYLSQAVDSSEDFTAWEIIDTFGNLLDWNLS